MTNCKRLIQKIEDDTLIYALDKFGDYGFLQIYKETEDLVNQAQKFLKEYNLTGIYRKLRKPENTEDRQNKTKLIAGTSAPLEYEVFENDIKFIIKPEKYFDVGLFLDHKITREMVSSHATNKNVLNLFSYTSSFSIYSAKNGAKSTTSVDLSKAYCEWSKENFLINNIDCALGSDHKKSSNTIWNMDVFEFIQLCGSNTKYDIIVLDPPSFSHGKFKDFNVQKDHANLIKLLQNNLLSTPGMLFFSTNLSTFRMDEYIRPGADNLTKKTIPPEFKPFRPHQSFVFYN